jgi:hypothetical protein
MGDYFQFSSVFIKKITKPKFFLKKNQNWFKLTGFSSVLVLEKKPVQTSLTRVFFGLDLVQFFRFYTYKTETEPADFFKILICFSSRFSFFSYFFNFLNFFSFFNFFSPIDFIIIIIGKGGLLLYKVKSLLTCSGPKLKLLFRSLFCSQNQAHRSTIMFFHQSIPRPDHTRRRRRTSQGEKNRKF